MRDLSLCLLSAALAYAGACADGYRGDRSNDGGGGVGGVGATGGGGIAGWGLDGGDGAVGDGAVGDGADSDGALLQEGGFTDASSSVDAPVADAGGDARAAVDAGDAAVTSGLVAVVKADLGGFQGGDCNELSDWDEMNGRFDVPTETQHVTSGWEFDTDDDDYWQPGHNTMPAWTSRGERPFRLRFTGHIETGQSGLHCFSIRNRDVGAPAPNACVQLYVASGPGGGWLVQDGKSAQPVDVERCVMLDQGHAAIEIVAQYFDANRHVLAVRHCFGDASPCNPDMPLGSVTLHP